MKYELILASESPRRRQLLTEAGFHFMLHPSKISETLKENLNVDDQILDIARRKAEASMKSLTPTKGLPRVVLAADTMVILDQSPLGKPSSKENAAEMLRLLSGRAHEVKTAICLMDEKSLNETSWVETTNVIFRELSESEIQAYVQSGDPMDKAGSYGIQGPAGQFVSSIEGSFSNVMGLPMESLLPVLNEKFNLENGIWSQIPNHVHVIAVSKLQPTAKILALHRALGHMDFGENYVQEALSKIEEFKNGTQIQIPLRWHFIGHLQSNKAKQIVGKFELIHSVDSLSLAQKISQAAKNAGLIQKILFQLNLANEDSKSGFDRAGFSADIPKLKELEGIDVQGLMTMPPLFDDPEKVRPYFRELNEILREMQVAWPEAKQLSMGTSADFRIAIEEGATMLRLGSILFGARPT